MSRRGGDRIRAGYGGVGPAGEHGDRGASSRFERAGWAARSMPSAMPRMTAPRRRSSPWPRSRETSWPSASPGGCRRPTPRPGDGTSPPASARSRGDPWPPAACTHGRRVGEVLAQPLPGTPPRGGRRPSARHGRGGARAAGEAVAERRVAQRPRWGRARRAGPRRAREHPCGAPALLSPARAQSTREPRDESGAPQARVAGVAHAASPSARRGVAVAERGDHVARGRRVRAVEVRRSCARRAGRGRGRGRDGRPRS